MFTLVLPILLIVIAAVIRELVLYAEDKLYAEVEADLAAERERYVG